MGQISWEDLVLSDPDDVDITALFEHVHGPDRRQQYEAVAGLYWLADCRPSRLVPWKEEVIGLLGEPFDFSLGDSGGSSTRHWATEAAGLFVSSYPRFAPDVFDLAASDDDRTREDAFTTLAHAVGQIDGDADDPPNLAREVHEHYPVVVDGLQDESPSIKSDALILLSKITPWYPEEVSEWVPTAISLLDTETADVSSISALREVALADDRFREDIVQRLVTLLDEIETDTMSRSIFILDTLVEIVEHDPACASLIDRYPEEMTEHELEPVRIKANKLNSLLDP